MRRGIMEKRLWSSMLECSNPEWCDMTFDSVGRRGERGHWNGVKKVSTEGVGFMATLGLATLGKEQQAENISWQMSGSSPGSSTPSLTFS
jgi:hypothetical protein